MNAPAVGRFLLLPMHFDPDCRACPRLATFLDEVRARHPDYHARPVPAFGDRAPGRASLERTEAQGLPVSPRQRLPPARRPAACQQLPLLPLQYPDAPPHPRDVRGGVRPDTKQGLTMPVGTIKLAGKLSREQKQKVAEEITATLERHAGKPASYTYIAFEELPDENWAIAGKLLDEDD